MDRHPDATRNAPSGIELPSIQCEADKRHLVVNRSEDGMDPGVDRQVLEGRLDVGDQHRPGLEPDEHHVYGTSSPKAGPNTRS